MSADTGFAVATALRFQIGARTLLSVPRRLLRVSWSLDDVLAERRRALPPLGKADGYLLTSVPETLLDTVRARGFVAHVRQRYVRYHVDLTIGHDAWLAGLSANARSALRRKAKRLGGEIRAYRTPDELAEFHRLARPLSALTYQERLLGSGLPDTPAHQAVVAALAEADAVRAWLLFHEGVAVAYLCCSAAGDTMLYEFVGHDPAWSHLSPGTVLHAEGMRQLFDDRFTRFDFTEGEGQHKRQFATGGVPCADLLLLRPTVANRLVLAALGGFDRAMALAKRMARDGWAKRLADHLRRA